MYTPCKELASKCCYCTTSQGCQGFQKLVEMKDAGIVLYCNTPTTDDVVLLSSTPCMVILLKMKNMKMKAEKTLPLLDTNRIPCPRCKRIVKHAQELLYKAPRMKSNILGICDHCRLKIESHEPCTECEKAIKIFLLAYGMGKKDVREFISIWQTGKKGESNKKDYKDLSRYNICRSYSDGDIDASKGRQLQAESMFHSESKIPGTDLFQIEQQERKEGRFKDLEDASEEYLKDTIYKTDSEAKKMQFEQTIHKADESSEQIDIEMDKKRVRKFTEKNEEDLIPMDEKSLDLEGVQARRDKDMEFKKNAPKFTPEGKILEDKNEITKGKDQGLDSLAEKNLIRFTKKEDDELKKHKQLEMDEKRVKDLADQKSQELKAKMKAEKDGMKIDHKPKSLDKKLHPNQRINASKSSILDKTLEDKKESTKGKNIGLDSLAEKNLIQLTKKKDDELKKHKQLEVDERGVKDLADQKSQELKAKMNAEKDGMKTDHKPKSLDKKLHPNQRINASKSSILDKTLEAKKETTKGKNKGLDSLAEKNLMQLTKKKDDELKKQKQLEVDEKRVKELADQKSQELKAKMNAEKDGMKIDHKPKSLDKKLHPNQQMNASKSTTLDKTLDDKKESTKGKNKGLDSLAEKNLIQLTKEKDDELKKQKQLEVDEKRVKDLADQKERELKAKMDAEKDSMMKMDHKPKSLEKKLDSKKDTTNETATKTITEEDRLKREQINNDFKNFEFMKMQAQLEREKREAVRKQQEMEKEQAKVNELAQKMLEKMLEKQQAELLPTQETVSEKSTSTSSTIIVCSENHKCKPNENKIITGENVSLHKPKVKSKPDYGKRKKNIPLMFENNLKLSPIHSPKALEITADIEKKTANIEKKKGTASII